MPSLMRFVAQRQPLWDRLEALVAMLARGRRLSAEEALELDRLYREVSSDLSLMQGRHPGGDYTRRLELLVLSAHHQLVPPRRNDGASLSGYLTSAFPGALYDHRRLLLLAAAFFMLGAAIGRVVAAQRPELGEAILGEDMLKSLSQGHLWVHDLDEASPLLLYLQIYFNNIMVILRAYVAGVLLGVGGLLLLLYNGLHFGSMLGVTARFGLEPDLLRFVTAHGPLEFLCLFIAGAAGASLGFALLAPGRLPRSQAAARAGLGSLPMILACLPLLGIAAFMESFVSPYELFPLPAKAVAGVGLLLTPLLLAWRRKRAKAAAPR